MENTCLENWARKCFGLITALILLMTLGAQTAFAATSYISTMSITLNVTPVPGESLPALETAYTSEGGAEVMIPSNDRYAISSAKWSSSVDEVKLGATYTIKVTLEAMNGYKFNSSYSSSKITVKGGTFVSASRQSTDKLTVTVRTKAAKGDLESPDDAYWESTRASSSKFGYAKWDSVSNAAYDVYLYRGSKIVHKVTDLRTTSYNFYPYMTTKGTYTFRVRAVASSDSMAAYAGNSGWTISDELYVDEDEVSDGKGQTASSSGSSSSETPETDVVGWVLDAKRWYFRYPDGTFIKDSWGKINGEWYLFDSSGVMLTGWQLVNGSYYYMNGNGQMQTGWLKEDGVWYYLTDNGAMATGWIQLGDKTYYLNDSGVMATGWQNVDGQMFYLYPDGHKAVNEVIDGFYVDLNGVWKKP